MGERDTYQLVLQLKDELTTSLKSINSSLKETKKAGKELQNTVKDQSKVWNEFKRGLISFVGPMATVRGAIHLLKATIGDSIQEYIEGEQAATKLTSAIKSVGMQNEISSKSLIRYSEALMKTTTFTDEQTQAAMAMLIQIGNFTERGVKRAIPALMDYASAMGIDITTAAEQMTFAIEGGRNVFNKYGVELTDKMSSTEKFDAIIKGLTESFKGNAEAMANTLGGQMVMFKNSIDELKESGGQLLAVFLRPSVEALNEMATRLKEAIDRQSDFNAALKNQKAAGSIADLEDQIEAIRAYNETFTMPVKNGNLLRQAWNLLWYEVSGKGIQDILGGTAKKAAENLTILEKQLEKLQQAEARRITNEKLINDAAENQKRADVAAAETQKKLLAEYAKTNAGQQQALLDEIMYWKSYTATSESEANKVIAIIEMLQKKWNEGFTSPIVPGVPEEQLGYGPYVAPDYTAAQEAIDLRALQIEQQKLIIALRKEEQQEGLTAEEIEARRLEQERLKALAIEEQLKLIKEQVKIAGLEILKDTYIGLAEAIGQAAAGTNDFAEAMQRLVAQILRSIGTLMIEKGLELVVANPALGIALMAAGGLTLVGAGAAGKYTKSSGISNPHAYASGGLVTEPTLALLGETGPEMVVPLSNPYRGQSRAASGIGGITINAPHARYIDGRTAAQLVRQGLKAMRT